MWVFQFPPNTTESKIFQISPTHSRCSGFINTDRKHVSVSSSRVPHMPPLHVGSFFQYPPNTTESKISQILPTHSLCSGFINTDLRHVTVSSSLIR